MYSAESNMQDVRFKCFKVKDEKLVIVKIQWNKP